ncbi:chromate transporter [Mesorhizobium sp. B292B1B]|uniref:chromate transporter n=2 Tax=Mesorhizobium TaxID=68287 RepID=UPI00112AA3FB|nr:MULTISPECIES: chromate transporter [unclassified Mesorhizobium]MCA0012163.1 chromate transporter [Mesorhizobium sp. B294B1A1]MCA0039255.1 chromate transporter [Mesorhizobium sp. B292B1B]TPM46072.1 chromate transporter [Mesorhizobium sp. B2-3-2]
MLAEKLENRSFMPQADIPLVKDALPSPSLFELFLAFAKLGITSIGGGVNGMMHTEFVVNRGWFTDRQFLSGLALAQSLPGVNVANLALWLGYQLRGFLGAFVALLAVVLPPAIAIILIGNVVLRLSADPAIGALLAGLAVAAAGLSLSVGYLAMRYACVDVISTVLFACTLVGASVFHLSALAIVAVLAPIGIGIGFVRKRHERR